MRSGGGRGRGGGYGTRGGGDSICGNGVAAGSGRWGTDGVCLHRRPSGSLAGPESNMVLVGCLWRKHSGNSVAGGGCTR
jgi:hypothetical protein